MRKIQYMVSAALVAFTAPAYAQVATPQADDAAEVGQGDIVVTATRRSEAVSDIPLAVSAVSAESLQNSGANDIRQLNQLAPSLLVSSTGSEANGAARVRGIGTVGDNPGLESSVAVFIDGVYRSRSGIGLSELGEVERIEVLRGPQGTLFGRNASAGLIHVISKKPDFNFGGSAEATYGNFNYFRLSAGITGPISETIAARIDGVYAKRDGFSTDILSGQDINTRDRLFVRGQLLFEPSDDISLRLIGDYANRAEACCAGSYKSTAETFDPTPGVPGDFGTRPTSRVVDILTSFGGLFPNPTDPFSRRVAITPGRTYGGKTTDGGASAELNWDFGGAALTSITAYREYKSEQAGDIDYSNVDLLARNFDGRSFRQFKTFTQELRLQGSLFEDKLDWIIGGFYSNEKLKTRSNPQFGNAYGQFLACRLVASISGSAALRDPDLDGDGCLSAAGSATVGGAFSGPNAAGGTDGSQLIAALQRLGTVGNVGEQGSGFNHTSENYAVFTHNIFKITDTLSFTIGARYTNEKKNIQSAFNNNNTFCPNQQLLTGPAIAGATSPTARALLGGAVQFACLFNSSSQLNALNIVDQIKEDEFTGTAVLSWKPFEDLLTYASYSKGYKAGGYNLDASALGSPLAPRTAADAVNLRFDAEKVNAFEVGFKYDGRRFNLNVAGFRQEFKSFQLNTFNGLFFLVQNVNGCGNLIGGSGADSDASAATGTCAAGDIKPGVISQGVEVEATAYPARNVSISAGVTYSSTKYAKDLVGNARGTAALATELFQLPGSRLSNAPAYVVTASFGWTPEIGSSGLSGLFYVDTRFQSDSNTGSDLFPEKAQDGYALVNGRVGIRGPKQRWAIELWGQNLLNKNYDQVAFNTPLQAAGSGSRAHQQAFGTATSFSAQTFSAFLGEPRTFGVTVRGKF